MCMTSYSSAFLNIWMTTTINSLCFGLWAVAHLMSTPRLVFSHLSLLVFDESHWGSCAVVDVLWLNPFVTGLGVSHIACVLSTNLTVIVHLVAQGIGVITFIDRALAREIKRIMGWLLWGERRQWLFPVSVVEMCFFKEGDALGAQAILLMSLDGSTGLESSLVLGLTTETTISGLEMGARDVWLGKFVEPFVDLPWGTEGVLERHLGVYGCIETVVTSNLDWVRGHLGLIRFALVIWSCDWALAESAMSWCKPVRIVSGFRNSISAEFIVGFHMSPGDDLSTFSGCSTCADGCAWVELPWVLLTELKVLTSQIINHGLDCGIISNALVRYPRKIELLLRRFETALLTDEISASVVINSHFPLILTVALSSHLVESALVCSAVELRGLSHNKIGSSQLLLLLTLHILVNWLNLTKALMHDLCVRLEGKTGIGWACGRRVFDRCTGNSSSEFLSGQVILSLSLRVY